jgi:hypothetical protein
VTCTAYSSERRGSGRTVAVAVIACVPISTRTWSGWATRLWNRMGDQVDDRCLRPAEVPQQGDHSRLGARVVAGDEDVARREAGGLGHHRHGGRVHRLDYPRPWQRRLKLLGQAGVGIDQIECGSAGVGDIDQDPAVEGARTDVFDACKDAEPGVAFTMTALSATTVRCDATGN